MSLTHTARVVFLGDPAVGKTSIIHQIAEHLIDPNATASIGVACSATDIQIDEAPMHMLIYDTVGQERSWSKTYCHHAAAVFVVYDITSASSFDAVPGWIETVPAAARKDVVIMLLGNKRDLERQRIVTKAEGRNLAKSHAILFKETAAGDSRKVTKAFEKVGRELRSRAALLGEPGRAVATLKPEPETRHDWGLSCSLM
jgi:small GTP-binding protein